MLQTRSSVITRPLDAEALAAQLDAQGFVEIEDAIDPAWVARAQATVNDLVERKGKRYFSLNWPAREDGSAWQQLTDDPRMRALMEDLVRIGCPSAKLDDEIYTGLRVVAGASGSGKSLIYHYDKYVITALAPVLIPPGPARRAGELLVFPNRRGYRPFTWINVLEKAIVQSGWYRRWQTRKLPAGELPGVKHLKPGNLYLFWGYRTYHTNFPVSENMVRATLLLHHGDPHPTSLILKAVKALQVRNERKILEKGAD